MTEPKPFVACTDTEHQGPAVRWPKLPGERFSTEQCGNCGTVVYTPADRPMADR